MLKKCLTEPMPDTYYDLAIDSISEIAEGNQENCLKQFFSGYPNRIRFEIFCFPDTGLQISVYFEKKNIFLYFSTKTYFAGTQKNRLIETVLLSTQNICLN